MSKKALAASVLTLSMLLSACGAGDSGQNESSPSASTSENTVSSSEALDKVQVDLRGGTQVPAVSFSTPFSTDREVARVLDEGTGDPLQDSDTVLVNASIFNGENGSLVGSSYNENEQSIPIQVGRLKTIEPTIYEVMKKMKVGGSFVYSTNVSHEQQQQQSASSVRPTVEAGSPTNLEVYTVARKLPTEKDLPKYAQGTEQAPNPKLPAFSLNETTGKAELKFADDRGEAPHELVAQDLITGTGAEVNENDAVYVRYIGAQWSDGKVFDGNYDKQVANFQLNGVIKGWKQGLKGKKVGSRVELVVPAELAYGEEGQNGGPKGTLVFVVDILATVPMSPAHASAQPSQQAKEPSSASPTAIPSSLAPTADPTKQ